MNRSFGPHPVSSAHNLLVFGWLTDWSQDEEVCDKAEVKPVAAILTKHEQVPDYGNWGGNWALAHRKPSLKRVQWE